jgi:hypothetical protein
MPNSSRKFTPPQPPTTPPKLIIPRSEARRKLEVHIEKGHGVVNRPINSQEEMDQTNADAEKWRDYAIRLLPTFFNTTSVAEDYKNKTQRTSFSIRDVHFTEERDTFKQRMSHRIRELESIQESLELYTESTAITAQQNASQDTNDAPKDPQVNALEKLELIAIRFHTVARQLLQRHRGHNTPRETLKVTDEYDAQDLFHALLRLFFDDVRDEEWTPSYAGGASRIDFLLKQEQVLVEIKMTRQGLTKEKDVSDQLIIDSERYRIHPDCKMLVAFVYDPQSILLI